jgi:exodeoxyribonuclease VII small subunit
MPSTPTPPPGDSAPPERFAPAERFEDLLGRLRGLVDRLEGGNLPLEDSLRAFEEGMELCRRGALILDGAEKKVETLLGAANGGAARAPFQMPDE